MDCGASRNGTEWRTGLEWIGVSPWRTKRSGRQGRNEEQWREAETIQVEFFGSLSDRKMERSNERYPGEAETDPGFRPGSVKGAKTLERGPRTKTDR